MSSPPVAIVTGAAKGIGAAIAKRLLAENYSVALVDHDRDGLERQQIGMQNVSGSSHHIVGDLAEMTFVHSLVDRVCQRFGSVDLLVNNAAWRETMTMREISLESWERTIRVCLTAPAFLARDAAQRMETQGGGVIINIGSMMAHQAAGFAPAYVACKGALESLTYDLAALYGPYGVRVVNISPGPIDTDLSRDLSNSQRSSDELREYGESMTMLGRFGTPDEVANLVVWAASKDASFLTGTTITFDAGWSRHHFPTALAQRNFEAPKR